VQGSVPLRVRIVVGEADVADPHPQLPGGEPREHDRLAPCGPVIRPRPAGDGPARQSGTAGGADAAGGAVASGEAGAVARLRWNDDQLKRRFTWAVPGGACPVCGSNPGPPPSAGAPAPPWPSARARPAPPACQSTPPPPPSATREATPASSPGRRAYRSKPPGACASPATASPSIARGSPGRRGRQASPAPPSPSAGC